MTLPEGLWPRILFCASFGSAAAALFSIAISQILLGLAIVAFIASRPRLALPVWFIPLGLFILWTLVSYFAAGDLRTGLPQIRKLYVFALLPLVYISFRSASDFKALAVVWMIAGSAAALRSCYQFAEKWLRAAQAGQDFYQSYVADRITGFMSHWMTFSSQMMFVFLAALCLLLWGHLERRLRFLAIFTLTVTGAALVLGFTRGVWLAAAAACLFLLARWKPWAVLALPVLLIGVTLAGPESLRTRITSIARPQGELDSNQHRIVSWTTGMKMIEAHPLLGLGPEQVGRQFDSYVASSFRRPLPEGFYGHLHNIYLQYSAERGIPATLFMLAFLLWPAALWLRAASKLPPGDPAIWALNFGVAAIIGVLVTGIFEHNLGDSEVLSLTLATLAATAAAQRQVPGSSGP